MNLGRASIPKYLLLSLLGAVAGVLAFSLFRSAAWERGIMMLALLILAGFLAYAVWLLAFKNRATRVATPQQKQAALQFLPLADKGVIYVYRKQLVGLLVGLDVMLDGKQIGQTRGLRFYRLELAPGTHVLAGDRKCPEPLTFQIAAGEVLYIEQELVMGLVKGSYRYRQVTDLSQAQQAVYSCKLLLANA